MTAIFYLSAAIAIIATFMVVSRAHAVHGVDFTVYYDDPVPERGRSRM